MVFFRVAALAGLFMAGCSAQRSFSPSESRVPATALRDAALATLRVRLAGQPLAPSCPRELRDSLPALASERVGFPSCSPRLHEAFAAAKGLLGIEEASAMTELLSGDCRFPGRSFEGGALEALTQAVDPGIPRARPEEETVRRASLGDELRGLRSEAEPLERWIRSKGDQVIPAESLEHLERLVMAGPCKLGDQDLEASYRLIGSLEELALLKPESDPQRARIERLLLGLQKLVDRKIREFFRHDGT